MEESMEQKEKASEVAPAKKKYKKPEIQSENLNSYGAICNGTTNGGRKASSTGPAFCNAGRLNS
jgi:hypothetical protein